MLGACGGSPGDMEILTKGTYMNLCLIIDSHLEKVDRNNKEINKMKKELKSGGGKKRK